MEIIPSRQEDKPKYRASDQRTAPLIIPVSMSMVKGRSSVNIEPPE
jgi:hypothetical protein